MTQPAQPRQLPADKVVAELGAIHAQVHAQLAAELAQTRVRLQLCEEEIAHLRAALTPSADTPPVG